MFGGIWRGSSHEKRRRGRTADLDRDRPRGGTGERCGDHPPRRHGGAQHRGDDQGAAGGDRLLSPHVRLRGEAVRGRQDPGRIHAPGGPAKRICAAQLELQQQIGLEKREWISATYPEHMLEIVGEYLALRLDQVLYSADKQTRENGLDELRGRAILELGERFPDYADIIGKLFDKALKDRVRQRVVEEGVRVDGRGLKDVRPISVEVGVLPRTHGSGLFTRGQTQALTIATLGSMSDQQELDGLPAAGVKRFMHHYNFPPYSRGEAPPQRGPVQRQVGH